MPPVDEPPPVEPSELLPVLAVTIPVLAVPSLVIDVVDVTPVIPVVAVASEVEPDTLDPPVPSVAVIAPLVGVAVVLVPGSDVDDRLVTLVAPDADIIVVDVSLPQPPRRPNEAAKTSPL